SALPSDQPAPRAAHWRRWKPPVSSSGLLRLATVDPAPSTRFAQPRHMPEDLPPFAPRRSFRHRPTAHGGGKVAGESPPPENSSLRQRPRPPPCARLRQL